MITVGLVFAALVAVLHGAENSTPGRCLVAD
jgi:hypothetical protein